MADDCLILLERCQKVGSRYDYGFNWTREFSRRWEADTPYDAGVRIRENDRPTTGYEWESSGGVSNGKQEPRWPKHDEIIPGTTTVKDGSLTWTARAISNASLRCRIAVSSGSVWTPPSADVTVDGEDETDLPGMQFTSAFAKGLIAGTYDILNTVTSTDGREFKGILRLTIHE